MIRIRNAVAEPAGGGGRTPRWTGREAAGYRLAFSNKGVRAENPASKGLRAVGYTRVSTAEQGDSGLGLTSQRRSIEQETERRAWHLAAIRQDVASGKTTRNRPALTDCLADLAAGRADVLIVAKLDRLIRSVSDFAAIVDTSKRQGWALVALDLNVDTSTPQGEFMANVMASMAQFERRLIGQRTKDAMAELRITGPKPGKKAIGRPRTVLDAVAAKIVRRRAAGFTLANIARELGLSRSTVQAILTRPGAGGIRLNS